MTQDQVLAVARQLLSFGGGFIVAKGYLTSDQLGQLMGLVAPVVAIYFSFRKSSPVQQIKTVDALPGVDQVKMNDPQLKKAVASPSVTMSANGLVTVIAIVVMAAMLGGCATRAPSAGMDPAITAGVKKTVATASEKAKAGLDAVCANYQYVDAAFSIAVTFAGNRIPQKYVDAEASAIALIERTCASNPADVQTAYKAVLDAYATALNIRNQFRNSSG